MSSVISSLPSIAIGFSRPAFEAFLASRSEPDWLVERRRAAFAIYEQKLAEPLNPEEYKGIDLRAFQPGRFAVSSASVARGE